MNGPACTGNRLTHLRVQRWNNGTSLGFISHNTLQQITPTANGTVSRNTLSAIKFNPAENVA